MLRSEEIAKLNETIAASVTGGDSFCYLMLASLGVSSPNGAILTIVHQGNYPLYDVGIRMVDLEKLEKEHSAALFRDLNFNAGKVSPNSARALRGWDLPNADRQRYNVFISTRNGFSTQLIRLKRVNEQWKLATKVFKDEGKTTTVLYERIDDDYPRSKGRSVDWE